MRPGVLPNWISPYQSFQHQSIQFLDSDNSPAFSGFTKDGSVFWIVKGPILEVLETQSRNRLAAWKFGHVLGDQHTNITCVKELVVDGKLHLLVGVCNVSQQGILCLFHVGTSRVVKAIEVPHQITELDLVCSVGGKYVPKWAFSSHLQQFYGIVAVGTNGGHIYLLDICLDIENGFSDEESLQKVHFITPRTRDIEQLRSQTVHKGQCLCIHLNEENFSRGCYQYQKPDNIILKSYPEEKVSVSCLKYIHQTGILVVGFDFGCYQLWNLHIPVLEYSSRLESNPKPITHVTYQEPENDPKNFCYIWVCRGPFEIDVDDEADKSFMTLYQLVFKKKTLYHNYGVFYEDLTSVCLRIDHELMASPVPTQSSRYGGGSRVLACYTLEDPHITTTKILDDESFDEGVHGPDLSLCLFVWEALEAHAKPTHHMAIFDMNRWYHAQMPSSIRHPGGPIDTCPYFAYFSLDSTLEQAANDKLLTVYIGMKSLRKYIDKSPVPSEQFFYPSSLAFNAIVVTTGGMLEVKFLGSQRQALADMMKKGPAALHQPQDMYRLFLFLGLLPRSQDAASLIANSTYPKEALLTVMLSHNLIGFIISCIQQWAGGEYEHHGCTLKFLLNWAWDKVSQTKQQIDSTCTCLYDWSGVMLDQRSLETLYTCYKRLNSIIIIFKALVDQSSAITEQGLSDVEEKIAVTSLIAQHLQMVTWFLDAGLLPENDEAEELMEGQYSYPAGTLIQAYKTRRLEAQQLDSGINGTEILMIDGLMKHLGPAVSALWEREGGNGHYPPPSFHALLSIYLLDELSLIAKHTLVLYVLMDLVSLSPEESALFEEKINTFVKQFYIPSQLVKQTQGFWLLDHKDFEEAIGLILHPTVRSELGRWQHCLIIRALLYQGEEKLALRYSENTFTSVTSATDMKLKLTVLLANGYISLALDFLRTCQDPANSIDLMNHFFLGCLETKKMGELLQFHLLDTEELLLVDFLLTSTAPLAQNLLVMHYLQRGKIVSAIQLNEKLKEADLMNVETEARERARTRNQIVDAYAARLPPVLKKLILDHQYSTKVRKPQRHEVQRPTPLSTKVTKTNSQVISQATYILMVMDSVDDDETEDEHVFEDKKTDSTCIPFISHMTTPSRLHLQQSDIPARIFPTVTSTSPGMPSAPVLSLRKSLGRLLSPPTSVSLSLRKRKYFSAEEVPLLKTPTVHRVTPVKKRLSTNKTTPQSILKVRRLISATLPSPHSTTPSSSDLDLSLKTGKSILLRTLDLKTPAPSQSGTPRSVSFAEPTALDTPRAAIVSDTPKRLRFTGLKPSPGSSGSSPDSPGTSAWSSSTPHYVKDRSPTPVSETHSTKFKLNVDNLRRMPVHPSPEIDRKESKDHAPAFDSDKEITFNFHKSTADNERETSGSTATFESFAADSSVASSSDIKDDTYELESSSNPQQDITSNITREITPLQILSDPDAGNSSIVSSMQVYQTEASEVQVNEDVEFDEEDEIEVEGIIGTDQDEGRMVKDETDFHLKDSSGTVYTNFVDQLPEEKELQACRTSFEIRKEFPKRENQTQLSVDSGGSNDDRERVHSTEDDLSDSGQVSLFTESIKRERISAESSPVRETETQTNFHQIIKKQHAPSPKQPSPSATVNIEVKQEVDELEVKRIMEDSNVDLNAKFVPKTKFKSLPSDENFPVVSSSPPMSRLNESREKSVESDRTEFLTPTKNKRLTNPDKVKAAEVLDASEVTAPKIEIVDDHVVGEHVSSIQMQKVVGRTAEETSFPSTPTRSAHRSKKAEVEDEVPVTPTRSSRRLRAKREVVLMDESKVSSSSSSRSPRRSKADSQSPTSSRRVTRRTLEIEGKDSESSSRSPVKATPSSSKRGKATEEVSGQTTSKSPTRKTRQESKSTLSNSPIFKKNLSPTKSPEKRKMDGAQSPVAISPKFKKTPVSEAKLTKRGNKSKSISSPRFISDDVREETVSLRKPSFQRKQINDSLIALKGQEEMEQDTTTLSRSKRRGTVDAEVQTSLLSSPARTSSRKGVAKEPSSQTPFPGRATKWASNRESVSPTQSVQNARSSSPSKSPQRTKVTEEASIILPKSAKSPNKNIDDQIDQNDDARTPTRSTRRRKGITADKTSTETPTKVTRKVEDSLKFTPSRKSRRKVESEETDDDKHSLSSPSSVTSTGIAFASFISKQMRRSVRLNKDESLSQEREISELNLIHPKKGKGDSSPENERQQEADVKQAKDVIDSRSRRTTPSRSVKKQKHELPVKSSSETEQEVNQPSDFVFSEPMQVEGISVESPARPFTSVKSVIFKSFMFSPPLSSPMTRSRLSSMSRAGSPLTMVDAVCTPNIHKTSAQSLGMTPASEEEVSLISPLDPGQVQLQSSRERMTSKNVKDTTRSKTTHVILRPRRSIRSRKITKITRH